MPLKKSTTEKGDKPSISFKIKIVTLTNISGKGGEKNLRGHPKVEAKQNLSWWC